MKVHIEKIGCRLNHSEAETIARQLEIAGYELASDADSADILIVNTCSVTHAAARDSRKAVRKGAATIRIATGCHADVAPDDLPATMIVPNRDKEMIADIVLRTAPPRPKPVDWVSASLDATYPLRMANTRAFVKIQDGCSLSCSYCITTVARGDLQTRPTEAIVAEVAQLARDGCQEVVLTGVHAAAYGKEIQGGSQLDSLLEKVLGTGIPRIRLSSIEPWNFAENWFYLWRDNPDRLCPSFHMSLQSGSATVLKRMRRAYTPDAYAEKLDAARRILDRPAFTTDLIAGFCGETDDEHKETKRFVEQCRFAGAHVFPYSPRPGTPAAGWADDVPAQVKKQRRTELQQLASESGRTYRLALQGAQAEVLWEQYDGRWLGLCMRGLQVTPAYATAVVQRNTCQTSFYADSGENTVPDDSVVFVTH